MLPPDTIHRLFESLDPPFIGEMLFDQLRDVVFFIKDAAGRYAVVNETLVERCGFQEKSQLVGRTASQVFRPPFGTSFEAQDRDLLRSAQPMLRRLELHNYPSLDVGWCLTTKLPLQDTTGKVIGLVGVSQDLRLPDASAEEYEHVQVAITHAEQNIETPPSVQELAEVAEMSRYQLDQRMQRVFGLTTGQWLLKLRIDLAQRLLRTTDDPIADIALRAGYSDQSAFSRQFRRATGLTPRDYRLAHEHS